MTASHPTVPLPRQWLLGVKLLVLGWIASLVAYFPLTLAAHVLPPVVLSVAGLAYVLVGLPILFYRLAYVYRAQFEGILHAGDGRRDDHDGGSS